ncbi:membrane-associated proteins in eicosanoid and glutathione metabolism [Gymnopus androsaceus JB14]|uniref:Membrane-associated proteins in eicosanoid and glutathione metabolism n=1 Tax=Gymnopus androsaceus JB14 TaxID=1447944 RepID=A0A6A4H4G2_9AGAR|nr:membrane-associated proteins in eicosanoid and glutathione metabolism [Gymnopus androsaceus JB14]
MSTTFTDSRRVYCSLPYVGAALLSTVFLITGQTIIVGARRKAAGIKYPQLYAEKAEVEKSFDALRFNCAQRAHQNTMEFIPLLYLTTCLTATKLPIVAASLCGTWVLARVFYTRGYVTGKPEKRGLGARTGILALFGLLGAATYVVGSAVKGQLGF